MSQTFLVSRTDAIGDVVLTLPVAGQLKQHFPGCRVVLIGRTYTAPVAAACPWVDDFLNLDELLQQPEPGQVATLQGYAAAAIIHVFPNRILARLALKAKIPVRIGTRNRWQHWLTCNRLVALSRRHSPLHEAQLNLLLLQPLGVAPLPSLLDVANLVQLRPVEPLPAPFRQLLQARQPGQLNVILHPRSRGSAREWGLDNFGHLAQLLHQAGHRVFLTGTAAEGEELRDWRHQHAAALTADLTGQLNLPQFISFIAAADGLVAGSTGPLHLAAALGRHALGLYPPIRPMHPGRWGPLGPHAGFMVFDKPTCDDCRTQPAACSCIRAIEPVAVAARVLTWQPLLLKDE
ncbi:glycosyltransferase family 9 protein [Hymenobacter sp. BT770]|uniref:glycosyltransferase family 9 protein n=1 Tax=Hymenobacter sp. BT770 TaxID=2886942 RepID=UPI001D119EA1|nr:glycosyltransferase family 9 protein [Hymenobacter sp. BT770]MCC3154353.1 glycosyltransferase family 9 protein [Hymenobacter sp. BT770]MDO3415674.1 glycosyltransferase family 9 protein [Hymenobacter sp. BT770]